MWNSRVQSFNNFFCLALDSRPIFIVKSQCAVLDSSIFLSLTWISRTMQDETFMHLHNNFRYLTLTDLQIYNSFMCGLWVMVSKVLFNSTKMAKVIKNLSTFSATFWYCWNLVSSYICFFPVKSTQVKGIFRSINCYKIGVIKSWQIAFVIAIFGTLRTT